ncbi:calcium/calmodulin-regulated receptor-like kinase 1 isoform X1 [Vitis riparia]|uniref:calcium/calmodulin-regulated receptor-like kinase 1 isoform X1 n=1 Tax=Vitis riparia TaxID=96939 RepID=UPI00155A0880|nr:calcium/calmodulin-regulated receptor-like kinase 1 isoform X1 [Vitis riparia]
MKKMRGMPGALIVGITVGVMIGGVLGVCAVCMLIRYRSKCSPKLSRRAATVPIRVNDVDSSANLSEFSVGRYSDSSLGQVSARTSEGNAMSAWVDMEGHKRKNAASAFGIPNYSYRELEKATCSFTTLIGQGAFGPVYKAQLSNGETVAVKVLATDSKQGKREFQAEILLLGRLHHRNLVNLVGYSADKGQLMLVYVYMSNGSLASHLYGQKHEPLSWDSRVSIALDVARGMEYLHYGAAPSIVHRDIKSSNILLDQSMRARVADFGLSREQIFKSHASNVKGTFGYLDPEYLSTKTFTKKSDVYSFGVLLFELIAGRNPLQGLMEYVELATIGTEDEVGWEEIVDSSLNGKFDVEELNDIASLAYQCINHLSKKRPSMRDIVLALSRILKLNHSRKRHKESMSATEEEITIELQKSETRDPTVMEFQKKVAIDITTQSVEI